MYKRKERIPQTRASVLDIRKEQKNHERIGSTVKPPVLQLYAAAEPIADGKNPSKNSDQQAFNSLHENSTSGRSKRGRKKEKLIDEMGEILQDIHRGSMQGIAIFSTWALEDRIDEMEKGSWKDFLISLLGNIIWASAIFVPGPGAAATASKVLVSKLKTYAVSMLGIAVASSPSIPKKIKGNVAQIQNLMYEYINDVYSQTKKGRSKMAEAILKEYPNMNINDLIDKWMEASFIPAILTKDKQSVPQYSINLNEVKNIMFIAGQMKYESMKAIDKIGLVDWESSSYFPAWIKGSRANKMGVFHVDIGGPGARRATLVNLVQNEHINIAIKYYKKRFGGHGIPTYKLIGNNEAEYVEG